MTSHPTTVEWCETRNHPWSTHNPWLDQTWCRCGTRAVDGHQQVDMDALFEISHTCDPAQPGACRCYLEEES